MSEEKTMSGAGRKHLRRLTIVAEFDEIQQWEWVRPKIQIIAGQTQIIGAIPTVFDFVCANPDYDWDLVSEGLADATAAFDEEAVRQRVASEKERAERRAKITAQKAEGKTFVHRVEIPNE